ncbi:MAG: hypothetical protein V9G13_07790 [Marmoricola sp.]
MRNFIVIMLVWKTEMPASLAILTNSSSHGDGRGRRRCRGCPSEQSWLKRAARSSGLQAFEEGELRVADDLHALVGEVGVKKPDSS